MSVRPTPTGTADDGGELEELEDGESETRTEDGGVTKRRTGPLLARRRRNLNRDAHITSDRFDHWREEDDHKIRRTVTEDKENGERVTDHDLTALEGAAPSTTTNLELLVIEAEQAAEADEADLPWMNPHIPANDEMLATAIEEIERAGLVPAWEVVDR